MSSSDRYPNNFALGVTCITIGMATSSLMDATIKSMSADYPLHEIVMARSLVAVFLTLAIVHYEGGLHLLKTPHLFVHLSRGGLFVVANMTFYLAIAAMPLAEATAIFFISPLIITALSVPILGEKVGWRRWLGVLTGFAGVLIIIRPGFSSFSFFSLLPVVAAFAYATSQIIARRMGSSEKASVKSFYIMLTFIVVSAAFWLLFGDGALEGRYDSGLDFLFRPWQWPNEIDALKMLAIGILVTIVGYMLNQAYTVANASLVAPFEFVALPLAVFWGYLFWNHLPDIAATIGMVLIAGSAVYVFIREKRTTVSKKPTETFKP